MNLWSKSDWKAHPTKHAKERWDMIVIHHSGDAGDVLTQHFAGDDAGFMRRIQEYHQSLGWGDVGYHFAVGPNGSILKGRRLSVSGAHARGVNAHAIGICVLGNCSLRPPTEVQLRSLKELLRFLRFVFEIDASGIVGHRDVNRTDCPGTLLYELLPELRAAK